MVVEPLDDELEAVDLSVVGVMDVVGIVEGLVTSSKPANTQVFINIDRRRVGECQARVWGTV